MVDQQGRGNHVTNKIAVYIDLGSSFSAKLKKYIMSVSQETVVQPPN